MSRQRITHAASDSNANHHDAGLIGLEHEIAATPTDQLIDHATLLIELPQPLSDASMPRLRLTLWEIQRRMVDDPVELLTPAQFLKRFRMDGAA